MSSLSFSYLYNKFCSNRKLCTCQPHSFLCLFLGHSGHFKKYSPGANNRHIFIDVAFPATHPCFRRLFRDGFIRKNTNPNPSTSTSKMRQCSTSSFYLPATHPTHGLRFQAIVAEIHVASPYGLPSTLASECFPKFCSFWC